MKRLAPLLGLLLLASIARAGEIVVFAAASLADALQEIGRNFETGHGDKVRFNFAASSLLARQIAAGAPADLFFSADEAKMNELEPAGLLEAGSRLSLLSNTLVVVVNAARPAALSAPADLASPALGRIAIGEPQTVPAGIYARQFLQKVELWAAVSPKTIPLENVRAVLAAVETGNVDAGFVYRTDALISRKVKIAFEISAPDAPRISYPVAIVQRTRDPAPAREFLHYLRSGAARAVFAKYGFGTPP